MYRIVLLLFALLGSLSAAGYQSFYDLYGQNRAESRGNLITADFISSAYADYKMLRESEVEQKILKPRVTYFADYLYGGVVEMPLPHKEKVLAYSATLSLLSKKGRNLQLPDGYEHLQTMIIAEAKLVINAGETAPSPILGVSVDYRKFAVPDRYKDSAAYYRTMKFAQTMPIQVPAEAESNRTIGAQLFDTIEASERLTNLYRAIYDTLRQFTGADISETKKATLFPSGETLDRLIFSKSKKPSVDDIIRVISASDTDPASLPAQIREQILDLDSSYAYDMKIMDTLIKAGYPNACKGYYTQIKSRTDLYTMKHQSLKSKTVDKKTPKRRERAAIEPNLTQTLDAMIENTLTFAQTINNNKIDLKMIEILKRLRKIEQKQSYEIALKPSEIDYLNRLDLTLIDLIGVKDRPVEVHVTDTLTQTLSSPKSFDKNALYGARYSHKEYRK